MIVFVHNLLVDHETYIEFSHVCILEFILFIADGKRATIVPFGFFLFVNENGDQFKIEPNPKKNLKKKNKYNIKNCQIKFIDSLSIRGRNFMALTYLKHSIDS